MPINKTLLPLALTLFLLSAARAEESLAPITVSETLVINPNISNQDGINMPSAPRTDGGDLLRQVNGISASRFGGRGLEPILRGQSQTQLNVRLDGAYLHGGCPNRMDPPASWAALETYDRITVLKGVQSLTYGPGGSGGTILFERDSQALAQEAQGLHGRISAAGSDNGIRQDLAADLIQSGTQGYARLLGAVKTSDNYNDGDGDTVRSAFEHQEAGLILGFTPKAGQHFEWSAENNRTTDVLYPGAGMDSPEESGNIWRMKYSGAFQHNWIERTTIELYRSDIEHTMDNFSLRTAPTYPSTHPKAGLPMRRETPTQSDTVGGRVLAESQAGRTRVHWGIDTQQIQRTATLNDIDSGIPKTISYLWPDVSLQQTGVFAEAAHRLAKANTLLLGLRIDHVDYTTGQADTTPSGGPKTANQVYSMYYGRTAQNDQDTALSALIRYTHKLGQSWRIFTGASRTVRVPDATERYVNKWGSEGNQRWVGNPGLAAEKHHQIDLGISAEHAQLQWSTVFFYDRVKDYILRDAARGQVGILQTDLADVYRNVSAELYGTEAEISTALTRSWHASTAVAWVHRTNTTDARPIAQTPPLNGTVQLDYRQPRWGFGAEIRWAAAQHRIDTLSKQEVGKTAGYTVFGLDGHRHLGSHWTLRLGADNLFDRNYAEHSNRANLMDPASIRVNEPGRSLWAKVTAIF